MNDERPVPSTPPPDHPAVADLHAELRAAGACPEAVVWAEGKDAKTIWDTCTRPEWLAWWIGRCSGGEPYSDARRPVVAMLCEIARLGLPSFEARYPGDRRPRACLEIHERWSKGESVPRADLKRAKADAAAASWSAYAAAAYYAAASVSAWSAADAADAAAALSASLSADAAAVAAAASGSAAVLAIIRKHYPVMPAFKGVSDAS